MDLVDALGAHPQRVVEQQLTHRLEIAGQRPADHVGIQPPRGRDRDQVCDADTSGLIAIQAERVVLAPAARASMRASANVVARLVESPEPAYGV